MDTKGKGSIATWIVAILALIAIIIGHDPNGK